MKRYVFFQEYKISNATDTGFVCDRTTGPRPRRADEPADDGQCTAGAVHSVSIPATTPGSHKSGQQIYPQSFLGLLQLC